MTLFNKFGYTLFNFKCKGVKNKVKEPTNIFLKNLHFYFYHFL